MDANQPAPSVGIATQSREPLALRIQSAMLEAVQELQAQGLNGNEHPRELRRAMMAARRRVLDAAGD